MRSVLLLSLLGVVACFKQPDLACAVQCQGSSDCPGELECNAQNLCAVTAATMCQDLMTDGGVEDATPADARVQTFPTCEGLTGASATIVALSVGADHTCAIDDQARAWCWGENGRGQLGSGDMDPHPRPVLVLGSGWTSLALGDGHTCGIAGGRVSCWGTNQGYELGLDNLNGSPRPVRLDDLNFRFDPAFDETANADFTAIAAGDFSTCALKEQTSEVVCWGDNQSDNQLGMAGPGSAFWGAGIYNGQPKVIPVNLPGINRIAIGGSHTCVLAGGQPYCWGANNHAEVTPGGFTETNVETVTAVTVNAAVQAFEIAAGSAASIVFRDGQQRAAFWGLNRGMQYVDAEMVGTGLSGYFFVDASVGQDTTCFILRNNTPGKADVLGCSGSSSTIMPPGEDHDAWITPFPYLVQAPAGVHLAKVVVGAHHACVLDEGGQVYCWGQRTAAFPLGDCQAAGNTLTPVQIPFIEAQ